jgi:glycosyltransferase involved in cell wall biosynthesis
LNTKPFSGRKSDLICPANAFELNFAPSLPSYAFSLFWRYTTIRLKIRHFFFNLQISKQDTKKPLVSIGFPVYNGEKYLRISIESILNQSYNDFELIISDNGSTDRTENICKAYARSDSRIQYHRHSANKGAAFNFNYTFQMASGKYFKWAAHDDILTSDFLKSCVEVLEQDASIILCQTQVQVIDQKGILDENHPHNSTRIDNFLSKINSDEAHLRFADLIQFFHPCIDIFGLMRAHILRKTMLIRPFIGSDRILLAELGLRGRFFRIPAPLFYSRSHEDRSIRIDDRLLVARWFDSRDRSRFVMPTWRNFVEYFKTIFRVKLPPKQCIYCCCHLLNYLWLNRGRLKLDIKLAARELAPRWLLASYKRFKSEKAPQPIKNTSNHHQKVRDK